MIQKILSGSPTDLTYRARVALEALGRPVLETTSSAFDFEAFARAGHAAMTPKEDVVQEIATAWCDGLSRAVETGWHEVRWDGATFDVVTLSWDSAGCGKGLKLVLAESMERAEAFFAAVCRFCVGTLDREILVFEDGYFEKSRELWEAIDAASLEDLVLPPELVSRLREDFVHFFDAKDLYARYRIPHKRGALLVGPPGNGKTHAIKALVKESGRACLYVKTLHSRCATDDSNIRDIFERAREVAPCVLVLEDVDALVTDSNRSVFLNELDGFAKNDGMLVVATSNHAERLDPALANRPSRFDRKYLFDLPAPSLRARWLEGWNARLEPSLTLPRPAIAHLAERTAGFSFAHLKELGTASLLRWVTEHGAFEPIVGAECEGLARQVADASR